jgi:hypothetical protein
MSDEAAISPDEPDRNDKQPMVNSEKKLFHDLAALRLDTANASAAVEILTHVPVRKPNRHEFFRVHPDYVLDTTVFTDQEERETYLVAPGMRAALVGEARPVILVPAISRQNALFIWPVALPGEDGRRNTWTETAQEAMRLAQEHWVRLAADMGLGAYRIYRAEGNSQTRSGRTRSCWRSRSRTG